MIVTAEMIASWEMKKNMLVQLPYKYGCQNIVTIIIILQIPLCYYPASTDLIKYSSAS